MARVLFVKLNKFKYCNNTNHPILTIIKFKYNPLEKKLWRIEDNYFYEISEENRFIEHLVYIGTLVKFKLGESHWLTLHSYAGLDKITVYYTKPAKNNELVLYDKKINPGWFRMETIFEFTEADRSKELEKNAP